jgi:hypothetical protein
MMIINRLFEDFVKIVAVATTANAFYHIIFNQKSAFKCCY